jgi:acetyltransferase-like isoleucine patch superfamily enzyme
MTGRQLFAIFKPMIGFLIAFMKLIPTVVWKATWPLVRSLPGTLGMGVRYLYFKRLCASCGKVSQIGPGVTIVGWENLHIGDNVSIHTGCFVDARGTVRIGNMSSIAHATSILSFEHTFADVDTPIKYNPLKMAEVSIGDDCWLGCGVRVLAGSTLETRCIVAAGAVVRSGTYSRGIYAGVPASLKRQI